MTDTKDIVVVGGGLSGLISTILLTKSGFDVTLVEKKVYPFHRVCGEYVSNEVKGFLIRNEIFPEEIGVTDINRLLLTSTSGRGIIANLPLGGFGISRYAFDNYLYQKAKSLGCDIIQGNSVTSIEKEGPDFRVKIDSGKTLLAKLVIGAYGKRSNLDQFLNRKFFQERSPYIGVKYHLKLEQPKDLIALHNFKDGYCGISRVENDTFNLCYLTHRKNLKTHKTIRELEENVLFRNPAIRMIYEQGNFLFDKPLVINEISFRSKPLIENGILMCGDSAGMITPLCGNGMAMAIHSAYLLSNIILQHKQGGSLDHSRISRRYTKAWANNFKTRLAVGRQIQNLFGGELTSEIALGILRTSLGRKIIRFTHGKPF